MAKKLKITGDRKVDKALARLDAKIAKKALRKSARESMKIVKAQAVANAPVGETGNLKKSIKVRSGKRSRSSISSQVITDKDKAYYSPMVEFGTQHQPANGFLRRAYDSKQDEARAKAIDQIKAEIKAAGKAK